MAFLFGDNFESWSSILSSYPGPWVNASGTWGSTQTNVNSSVAGVFRTASSGAAGSLVCGFPNKETIISNVRVSFDTSGAIDNGAVLWFIDETTTQLSLRMQPNGYLAVYRGFSTAKLGESNNFFPFNTDEYLDIELKATFNNTTGSVELRVNGIVELTLINQNTRATSNNFCNQARIGKSENNQVARPYFKHFILMDTTGTEMNDFIGPKDTSTLRPTGTDPTDYIDWTANTGTRWQAVNQAIADGDTTYVSANTVGDQILFDLSDLPAGVTSVAGVMPQCQAKREQGTTRVTRFFFGSGVDTELGTKDLAIGPTYAFRQEPITLSPFTTSAWTPAEVNGLKLGMEITV
jgi:hypothetical protein